MPNAFVFIDVEDKDTADLEMEFNSGQAVAQQAIVLTCLVVNIDTTEKEQMTLVVPKSQGFDLLRHLLTDDQLEAVMCL